MSQSEEKPVVFAKCKRGSDKLTEGQNCSSLRAENLSAPGSTLVQFKCVKCSYAWNVPVGGACKDV